MGERPGPWELLDRPSDPVVADVVAVDARLSYFSQLAESMRTEGQRLAKIASGDALKGKYADELRSGAGDVAHDLNQVVGRYQAVVQAVQEYRPALDSALSGSAQALDDAIDADSAQRTANAMPTATAPAGAQLTAQQIQANADRTAAVGQAADRLNAAKAKLSSVLERLDDAGRQAAATIRHGFNDGLTDSGWDRFKYAFKKFLQILIKVLTYIGMALAVIALVIPGLGEAIFAAGVAIAAVTVVANGALLAMGGGSWADFGIALAGLLTFGAAKLFGPAIQTGLKSLGGSIARGLGRGGAAAAEDAESAAGADAASDVGSGDSVTTDIADDVAANSGAAAETDAGAEGAATEGSSVSASAGDEDPLTKYLGGGALKLNQYLRDGGVGDPELDNLASAISNKLNDLPAIGHEITVFRGVTGNLARQLTRGDTFTENGFMSTSTSRNTVDEFMATGGELNGVNNSGEATRFTFYTDGQAGRDVTDLTGLGEGEVLFDRGSTWEVVGVKSAPEILPVNGQSIKVWGVMLKTPGFDID